MPLFCARLGGNIKESQPMPQKTTKLLQLTLSSAERILLTQTWQHSHCHRYSLPTRQALQIKLLRRCTEVKEICEHTAHNILTYLLLT
eukprot:439647-Pyramimonas_sp.AAC.2